MWLIIAFTETTTTDIANVMTPAQFVANKATKLQPVGTIADNMYQCENGEYIQFSLVCDGNPHCRDRTDEQNCSMNIYVIC